MASVFENLQYFFSDSSTVSRLKVHSFFLSSVVKIDGFYFKYSDWWVFWPYKLPESFQAKIFLFSFHDVNSLKKLDFKVIVHHFKNLRKTAPVFWGQVQGTIRILEARKTLFIFLTLKYHLNIIKGCRYKIAIVLISEPEQYYFF